MVEKPFPSPAERESSRRRPLGQDHASSAGRDPLPDRIGEASGDFSSPRTDPKSVEAPSAGLPGGIAGCTIVSKNYLSLARVWNASFKRHHPGSPTFVLIVDRIDGAFDPRQEDFEAIEQKLPFTRPALVVVDKRASRGIHQVKSRHFRSHDVLPK